MNSARQHEIIVKIHDRLGVLERILRVIRHRGGQIKSMQMHMEDNQTLSLSLSLVTVKSVGMLHNQITKLIDVIKVEYK